ncbi:hypothetical protein [Rhodoferax sp.]|uniref:hypothetical protein n=1 Tax=Rhodoferax sp. TaxID=50421 RepID=UPI0019F482E5|nr:hypothetical protein [Rhodoferax sp.]MBE0473241.1 hypothetical protein [Rhodoferax sp.]
MRSATKPALTVFALAARRQKLALALAGLPLLGVAMQVAPGGWRPVTLWIIGLVLGVALYHASFGFASAYRRMISMNLVHYVSANATYLLTRLFALFLFSWCVRTWLP